MPNARVSAAIRICENFCRNTIELHPGEDINERTLARHIENTLSVLHATEQIDLTEEEKEEFRREEEYIHKISQDDGAIIRDDYDDPEWFTDFLATPDENFSKEDGDRKKRFFWLRYRTHLLSDGFPLTVVNKLDTVTLNDLMNQLGNPRRSEPFLKRGLVVGDVQSGKTATYTGLICKAADAGYKIIILLTGTIEGLRKQTQKRLEEGFTGFDMTARAEGRDDVRVGVGEDPDNRDIPRLHIPKINSLTSQGGDFKGNDQALQLDDNTIFFLAIKKNASVLEKLINWLIDMNADWITRKIDAPLLLIDDEADNASINTHKKDEDPTVINRHIRMLADVFTRTTYVGFTATPFANVFINPVTGDMEKEDLFPANFIFSLEAPSNYIGSTKIFPEDAPYHSALNLIEDAGVEEEDGYSFFYKHPKEWTGELPESLTDAIYSFFIVNAIRDLRGDRDSHRTMMINISRFVPVHNVIKSAVDEIIDDLHTALCYHFDPHHPERLTNPTLRKIHEVWEDQYESGSRRVEFSWDDVARKLCESNENLQTMVVNSKSKDVLNYDQYKRMNHTGLRVIAIGGLALSRGLTLEGLVVTYFYRNTCTYDVLMQMGRWFGYRHGYEDIFRIWTSSQTIRWYRDIAEATDELKTDIRHMQEQHLKPKDFGIRVRQISDELQITASIKMRFARMQEEQINMSGAFLETPYIANDVPLNTANRQAVVSLLDRVLPSKDALSRNDDVGHGRFFIPDVPRRDMLKFLSEIKVSDYNRRFPVAGIIDYIQKTSGSSFDFWDIAFIEGKRNQSAGPYSFYGQSIFPIERRFSVSREERARIDIGTRGKLAGTYEGQTGLSRKNKDDLLKIKEAMAAAERNFKEQYPDRKWGNNYPSDAWFKYIKDRKPLLLIYFINLKSAIPADADREYMEKALKDFPASQNPLLGFAMGFPTDGSDTPRILKYRTNVVFDNQQQQAMAAENNSEEE